MKFAVLSLVFAIIAPALGTQINLKAKPDQARVGAACSLLQSKFNKQTFLHGSSQYKKENQHYYSKVAWIGPACVFLPESAADVSFAVTNLAQLKAPFAVRGGGHVPGPEAANIKDGVLIGLTRLNQIQLSTDRSYCSVGPGNRWVAVYKYLEPTGLIVLGGRIGAVGVPGYLLGGGISYYSNQYGWASSSVQKYEIVLSNGTITDVSSTSNPSLFWALKGGGNNFGIVTRFDLKTYPSPAIHNGLLIVPEKNSDAFLRALADFAQHGALDSKAAVIPTMDTMPSTGKTVYATSMFYDGDDAAPAAFVNFTALAKPYGFLKRTTLAGATELSGGNLNFGNEQFMAFSSAGTYEALKIVHDTFLAESQRQVHDVKEFFATMAFQPITKNFLQQSVDRGGTPQGVDIEKAPYFWMTQSFSWLKSADNDRIFAFSRSVTQTIKAKLDAAGLLVPFTYMNDAGAGQDIYPTYANGSLAKLQAIRSQYDPSRVFTDLMPGGYKLGGD